jgi:hypothetical protein
LLYNKSINIVPIIIWLDLLEITCLFLLVFLISSSGSKNLILIITSCCFCLVNLSFWFLNIIFEIYILEKSTSHNYTSLAQTVSTAKKNQAPAPPAARTPLLASCLIHATVARASCSRRACLAPITRLVLSGGKRKDPCWKYISSVFSGYFFGRYTCYPAPSIIS